MFVVDRVQAENEGRLRKSCSVGDDYGIQKKPATGYIGVKKDAGENPTLQMNRGPLKKYADSFHSLRRLAGSAAVDSAS